MGKHIALAPKSRTVLNSALLPRRLCHDEARVEPEIQSRRRHYLRAWILQKPKLTINLSTQLTALDTAATLQVRDYAHWQTLHSAVRDRRGGEPLSQSSNATLLLSV